MSKRTRFTAYITKYALTDGIEVKEVEDCFDTADDMVSAGRLEIYHGKDWHRTMANAVKRAKEMQAAKLKSIDKQRARIAALTFGEKA
jgi:hypothetical protein